MAPPPVGTATTDSSSRAELPGRSRSPRWPRFLGANCWSGRTGPSVNRCSEDSVTPQQDGSRHVTTSSTPTKASERPLCPRPTGAEPAIRAPWPDWIEWKPGRVWCYDFTHFTRARRVAVAVLDVVSRRWLATLVSAEETSSQIEAAFLAALDEEQLAERIDARLLAALRAGTATAAELDGPEADGVPVLIAMIDHGPQMSGLLPVLRGVTLPLGTHGEHPSSPGRRPSIRMSTERGQPQALSDRAEQTALQHVIDRGQLIPVDPDQ